jgi:hypothetical protein
MTHCTRCGKPLTEVHYHRGLPYGPTCIGMVVATPAKRRQGQAEGTIQLRHASFVGGLAWVPLQRFTVEDANAMLRELTERGIVDVEVVT